MFFFFFKAGISLNMFSLESQLFESSLKISGSAKTSSKIWEVTTTPRHFAFFTLLPSQVHGGTF